MAETIPQEAKDLMAKFQAEEAQRAEQRAQSKEGKLSKKVMNESRLKEGHLNAGAIEAYALRWGFKVDTGGGRHGKHLIAPDGRHCSLPDHSGHDMPTGTSRLILKFIHQNGISPN